jgi:hypothetical protein
MAASWTRVRTASTIVRLLPAYIAFGVLKRTVPLDTLARWAWRPPRAEPDPVREARTVACIVRIDRLSGRMDRSCLQRSLLLYRELSRLGSAPTLCVGFRPGEGGLKGHAWVELRGRAVLDDGPSLQGFVRAFSYGSGGAIVTANERPASSAGSAFTGPCRSRSPRPRPPPARPR